MNRPLKWILVGVIFFALLFGLALNINFHRVWLLEKVNQQFHLTVQVEHIDHSWLSPTKIGLEGVNISNSNISLLAIDTLNVHIDFWSLLGKDIVITDFSAENGNVLADPQLWLPEQAVDEETSANESSPLPINLLAIEKLSISGLNIKQTTPQLILNNIALQLQDVKLIENAELLVLRSELTLQLAVEAAQYVDFVVSNIQVQANVTEQVLVLSEMTANVFDGEIGLSAQSQLNEGFSTAFNLAIQDMNVVIDPALFASLGMVPTPENTEQSAAAEHNEVDTTSDLPIQKLILTRFALNNTNVSYALSEEPASVKNVSVDIQNIALINDFQLLSVENWSDLSGVINASAQDIDYPPYAFSDFSVAGTLEQQIVDLSNIAVKGFGVDIAMALNADLAQPTLPIKIQTRKFDTQLTDYHKQWIPGEIWPEGDLSIASNVSFEGANPETLLTSVNGDFLVTSQGMILHGLNVNNILQGIEESENVGLIDIAAVAATGPLGLVYSQMATLGKTGLTAQNGETEFSAINLAGQLDSGVVTTRDMAFATDSYLVAFDGGLDLPKMAFNELDFALLDEKNCALAKQTLNGEFSAPDGIAGMLATTTAIKPFTNILSDATGLLSECEPIYSGVVGHPKNLDVSGD